VPAGNIATVTPDVLMLNDVSGPIAFEQFESIGSARLAAADRVVLVADHFAPASDIVSATAIKSLRDFAGRHGVRHVYEPGRGGIEHALLDELGMIGHGTVVFGADGHTCTAGAFNALGMGYGSSDLAATLAVGRLWMLVPESIRVEFTGTTGPFVTGKDIILTLIRQIGVDGAASASLEFGGPGLSALGMDERMAIANMAVEAGADTCVFEGDARSLAHAKARGRSDSGAVFADAGARYRDRIVIDLSKLSPMVAAPPSPGSGAPVESFAGQKVDQVYVGNCSNGTITDLRQVAEILRGRTIAPHVRMVVVPATQAIWRAALSEGLLDIFTAAGAVVSPPTCGACFGGHMGILAAGETAIATTNRNFRGRMGHPESRVYLANAWVAAASAVRGEITPPQALMPIAGGRS
jgi:3-isopropylmalate/(R)-2-methylmalate dehydratase large subunit